MWSASQGRLEIADTVHHIIPADEDPSRIWDESNLIPVSRASHAEIHKLYATDQATKAATQSALRSMVISLDRFVD